MMYFMTFNIFTHRSTNMAYCPPNTAEKDKITFNPFPPPAPSKPSFKLRSRQEIPYPDPLPPLLSPPHKIAKVQSQLSNVDTSSDYEGNPSKSIVANPFYPHSTSSNQTTPTSVNI